MNINVLIIVVLLIFSFIIGFSFGKFKTKEKYENKRCFYCGHSEKEKHTIKWLDKELRKKNKIIYMEEIYD